MVQFLPVLKGEFIEESPRFLPFVSCFEVQHVFPIYTCMHMKVYCPLKHRGLYSFIKIIDMHLDGRGFYSSRAQVLTRSHFPVHGLIKYASLYFSFGISILEMYWYVCYERFLLCFGILI